MLYESELVRSAIDARARHISKLKIDIHGAARPKMQTQLKHRPNEWMTYSQFLYRASTILDCTNTCFIVPVLNDELETVGIYPLLPFYATVIDYNGEPWLKYQFNNGYVGAVELQKCAILTKYQYKNEWFGESNGALDDTMALLNIQNQGIQEAVKNSASYRFIAKLTNFAKPEDLTKERMRFTRENLSANADGGGLLLFPNTYSDVKQIESKPYTVDSSQMEYIRSNVERYYGVNPKVLENSANGDELDAFYNGAIEPFAIQLAESLSGALFTDVERSHGSYVLVLANKLQYMSTTAKVQMAKELGDRGVLTINEIRELFNYSPIDGGDEAVIRGEYYALTEKVTGEDENENNAEL